MSAFANSNELSLVMSRLWESIKHDPSVSQPLLKSRLIAQFDYYDPDGLLTIDCSDGENMKITLGESSKKPNVQMRMRADVAHEFWMGHLKAPIALMNGKISVKGSAQPLLRLVPVLQPAFSYYPKLFDQSKKQCEVGAHLA